MHLVVVTSPFLEMAVGSSLAEERVKKRYSCFRVADAGHSTSRDPAVGMISYLDGSCRRKATKRRQWELHQFGSL